MRIIFMGTPNFAVASLKILVENNFDVIAVITAPDKQSGRGLKIKFNDVKVYAQSKNIPVLQPTNLKSEKFIKELKDLNADLQVVVAFRMLPEVVWSMPQKGTINLHASLLPDYRGAAPINWVIINGETKTGATTFFIEKEIDTGKLIDQVETPISPDENCGELHDRLMDLGAKLILKSVQEIKENKVIPKEQNNALAIHSAPKLDNENTKIDWNKDAKSIKNLVRGLDPYPVAWTTFDNKILKVYEVKILNKSEQNQNMEKIKVGDDWYFTDFKNKLIKETKTDFISIEVLKLEGKQKMNISDFLRGYRF